MKKLKIGDIVVMSVILLITAGVFCFRLFGFGKADSVLISIDGNESVYSLNEKRVIDIENNGVKLCVAVENGSVFIAQSDCPEKSCVNMGKISKVGQSIACVPARLYVKIIGEGDNEYDFIVG